MKHRPVVQLAVIACFAALGTAPRAAIGQQAPPIDFSGVMFMNYQQRSDSVSKAANGGHGASKFDIERVYLTFRMPAGDRASIRVTSDIFNGDQSGASYYKGWAMRMKFAYLQMNVATAFAGVNGLGVAARVGMIPSVIVDQEEGIWPRYLGQVSVEKTGGFFSSADLGAAAIVTLPRKWGEVYAAVLNGPGYQTAENDRFKDFGARASLTPFANSDAAGGWLKTLAITPWFYAGKTASKFQNGGAGQVGAVDEGLTRRRSGVLVALKDRRVTGGVQLANRVETVESGANTLVSPRATRDNTGRLTAVFATVRPGAFSSLNGAASRWGLIARMDDFKPDTDADAANRFTVFGAFWDPTSRVTLALDAQQLARRNGSSVLETKGLYLHVQATF